MARSTISNPATFQPLFKPGTWKDLALIAALWLIAVIIVNPVGDFPLNDDWSMGMTVKRLLSSGDYRPDGWVSMTLISQVLWGALFCAPHGFSFTALRFSTLTLSLIGVIALYLLIRQLHKDRRVAVFGTMLLAFNPIYFALSNTFMTDVPFTAMATVTALFFVRYFQTESLPMLLLATALAIICTLCRQLGLAIPLAFTVTLLLKNGFHKQQLTRAWIPSIAVLGSWLLFNHWLRVSGRAPAAYDLKTDELLAVLHKPITIPLYLAHHGWNALMYLGCFLLPLFAVTLPHKTSKRITLLTKGALAFFLIITAARFIFMPGLMPVHNNILDPRGIGPLTLRDVQLLGLPHVRPLSKTFWLLVTALSLLGTWVLIYRSSIVLSVLSSGEPSPENTATPKRSAPWRHAILNWRSGLNNSSEGSARTLATFFLLCTLIYLAPLIVSGFFDRYLLPALIFLVAILSITAAAAPVPPLRWQRLAALFFVLALAWYAVAGTRDYLTWNRVRWTALADLQRANVPPEKIDGGFEFNGWHFYDPKYQAKDGKSNWWVVDDEYLLSFREMIGYEKIKEYTYSRWLPPSHGQILVLKRKAPTQSGFAATAPSLH